MTAFLIRIGTYLFRTRNYVFPAFIAALYLLAAPRSNPFAIAGFAASKEVLALILVALGLLVRGIVIGYAYIKRGGLNKQVYAETLVVEGMFSLCRNPLYLGNMLIYSGVFVMHGAPLVMALGIGLFFCIYIAIIATEEAYLRNKFGASYVDYCNTTPRWLPVISRFKTATQGMNFTLRRVIAKDYSTFATAAIALSVTKIYEIIARDNLYLARGDIDLARYDIVALIGVIIAVLLLTLVINRAKKRGKFIEKTS